MHLDLTDLRLFVNVMQAGTLTAGAAASHMTLASASERIRGMEDSLGTPLLVRASRGVSATPAGHTLLQHARRILQQLAQLQGDMGDYGRGLKGHIQLLCNTSALSEHLPQVLGPFLTQHPGIAIDLEERASADIVDAVRREVCDIGIVSDTVDLSGLETRVFRPDPLVLVVPQAHALAQHARLGLADVADQAFVGLSAGSAFHEHLAQQARRIGKRLHYRIRLGGFESVCQMVGQGIGVGIVPLAVAQRCGRRAKLKRITLTDSWAKRHLVLCVRQLDALPAHVQQLVQCVLAQRPQ
ncbi:LysR substrate-binding domain-containing protein [Variovorax sp. HJSM1_2]|uniref:LysR substrate-binding domain-containing protein n=1 Tax=Variovorax sp. HJSM1_2 TaxID=3366263 RepID=UPI003BC13A69